jgi:hypothetical protein
MRPYLAITEPQASLKEIPPDFIGQTLPHIVSAWSEKA